ncbi:MAG: response regulator [Aggregatilineales bacterium]
MDVIIVEDDPSTGEIYTRALERKGFTSTLITRGDEAVSYFENKASIIPKLVILDVNLPGNSGLYILRFLRQKLKLTDLKIIVSSANSLAKDAPEMTLADRFLAKPCSPRALVEVVQGLLDGVVE